MRLYDNYRRPLAAGDLVMHTDSGFIGFVLGVEDDNGVTVFICNKVRSLFVTSVSRIRDTIR